jgi:hypothetical protein
MLQDGAILSEKYPDNEWCHVFMGLDGYDKLVTYAHGVLRVLNFVYENGCGGITSLKHISLVCPIQAIP